MENNLFFHCAECGQVYHKRVGTLSKCTTPYCSSHKFIEGDVPQLQVSASLRFQIHRLVAWSNEDLISWRKKNNKSPAQLLTVEDFIKAWYEKAS